MKQREINTFDDIGLLSLPHSGVYNLKKLWHNIFRKGVGTMPTIKSSTDLRNNYNDISTLCHQNREPIFITKNGQGDLAIMSIDLYEALNNRLELYRLLSEGRTAINEGRKRPLGEAMQGLRKQVAERANG